MKKPYQAEDYRKNGRKVMDDMWQGCYDDSWQGDIVPEAFSHPAKFSRDLIHRIYRHVKDMAWVKPGGVVLDPFGGCALGGLDAMSMGLHWVGVELEAKFVELGRQNIELWERTLRGWPNLGTARIIQGDSRQIRDAIEKADILVSSPPFHDSLACSESNGIGSGIEAQRKRGEGSRKGRISEIYGHTPGNIANLKEGDFRVIIGSPPYCEARIGQVSGQEQCGHHDAYSRAEGQLGALKEGSFDAVVSSPPYEGSIINSKSNAIDWEKAGRPDRCKPSPNRTSPGVDAGLKYSESIYNLGNLSGDTFWSASKEILQGCHTLLRDGCHAIWVCKDYVKAGKRVPFSDRWQALCESVGFKIVCRHRAMLVKSHGKQVCINGECEEIQTERKSFFRRLAESKGSPKINWEDVLCFYR